MIERCTRHLRRSALLGTLALLAGALHAAEAEELRFTVLFDGKRIGTHTFEVIDDGRVTRVHSRAGFDVKVLFVPVYRYRHHANELWQDGCLTALAAATETNGERSRIRARTQPEGLLLTRQHDQPAADLLETACPATFAYWDRSRLQRDRLINAQTGEAIPSTLTFEGEDTVNGAPARRYRLEAGDLPAILVWYGQDDTWLALRTERDGGVLEYALEHAERRPVSGIDEYAGVEDPVGI